MRVPWVRQISWSVSAVGQAHLLVCMCRISLAPGAAAPRLVMTLYSSTLSESKGQGLAPRVMLSLQQFYV